MCGFVTCFGSPEDFKYIEPAREKLTHRGPDDFGLFVDKKAPVAFGHRRLSIIDIDKGKQPLTRQGATVVFNGEIYNYIELRRELKQSGYQFTTDSDTEVLVQAYREWGKNCLKRLRGMFAFVIWDEKNECLFLARDRLGQKPLFFARNKNKLAAASEIQALLEFPWISRKLNRKSLNQYLYFKYISSPASGFADINKLKPAHYLIYQGGEVKEHQRYWELSYKNREKLEFEQVRSELRSRLKDATRLRLRSDVPLGAFLSGGIDSSITVSMMSELLAEPVETFTISFDTGRFDETDYAAEVAKKCGTNHHEFKVKPDFVEILPRLIKHYGEPLADPSIIPTYYVARETSDYVKVCLSGDGGDELFGGYGRYLRFEEALFNFLPKKLLPAGELSSAFQTMVRSWPRRLLQTGLFDKFYSFIQRIANNPAYIYGADCVSPQSRTALSRLLKEAPLETPEANLEGLFEQFSELKDIKERAMAVDTFSYLPENILPKVDIATMKNSLECRSPFLDHKVVEFAATLPVEYKIKGGRKKHLLKEAFKKELPASIINRPKQGFLFPFASWFRGPLEAYLKERLLSKHDLFHRLIDRTELEAVIAEHSRLKYNHGWLLWNLLVLRIWLEEMGVTF